MPEITKILTDDVGTITHLVTLDSDRLTVTELAEHLERGDDYYVTFGDERRYTITIVAEDGHLEPTIDDAEGVHSIWDLEREQDPEEEEIESMFDEMSRMGEYGEENFEGMRDRSNDAENLEGLL